MTWFQTFVFLMVVPAMVPAATVQYNSALLGSFSNAGQTVYGADGNLHVIVNGGQSVVSVSPAGNIVWSWTGSNGAMIAAIAVRSDGATYVAGQGSPSLPNSRSLEAASTSSRGYVAEFDTAGNGLLVTGLGGLIPEALALDSTGNVYISGYQATGGSFTAKLDANVDAIAYLNPSVGSNVLTVDASGQVYLAGAAATIAPGPIATANGYQSGGKQWVAGLDSKGQIRFVSYIGGSNALDAPYSLAVDSEGNIYIAGSTESTDLPTTANALQPNFPSLPIDVGRLLPAPSCVVSLPAPPNQSGSCLPGSPSPSSGQVSGYLTILSPAAASLSYSTYFGGSGATVLSGLALDQVNGRILLAGASNSTDVPGLASGTEKCLPGSFSAALTLNGSGLLPTVPISTSFGRPFSLTHPSLAPVTDGTVAISSGITSEIAIVDRSASSPLACLADAASEQPMRTIAPGQLLTVFGSGMATSAWAAAPVDGHYPVVSPDNVSVTVNGLAAPLLYTSPDQINLQVPFEISPGSLANVRVSAASGTETAQSIYISEFQPSVFQLPIPKGQCASSWAGQMATFAFNADGTRNSCANPAQSGSLVTLFVDGLGLFDGTQQTGGVVAPYLRTNADLSFQLPSGTWSVSAVTPLTGSITGMYQVQVQVGTAGYDLVDYLVGPTSGNLISDDLVDIRVVPDAPNQ